MDTTWIKLYRKAKENPIMQDPIAWLIFTWLLMSVDRETGKKEVGSYLLADIFKINRSTVRDALTRLERKYKLTTNATTGRYTTVSVLHWHVYQSGKTTDAYSDARTTPSQRQDDATPQEYKNRDIKNNTLGSQKANHAKVGEVVKEKRTSITYPREIINDIVNYYAERKGITPQGNEWLPIQQAVKSMLMSGRTPQEIKDFAYWLSTHWGVWDIHTMMKRMPEFVAGKLDAEKNKINPIIADPIFKQLCELNGTLTDAQMRYKMMLESKLGQKYPNWRYEKEWAEASKKQRETPTEKKDIGELTEFRTALVARMAVN